MTKRYKATRSLHYVTTKGEDVFIQEGDWVDDAPDQTLADLIADGFVRESRAKE